MNQINVIKPYFLAEIDSWVFDDPAKGLVQEPFVMGVGEMIDVLTADFPNAPGGFKLMFSDQEFPVEEGSQSARLTFFEEEMGGAWYVGKFYQGFTDYDFSQGTTEYHMEGWLCPALLKYYPKPPMFLYIAASP
ncbi:hypothetical protein LCGC14_2716130, partial [marine sediment metagenome]